MAMTTSPIQCQRTFPASTTQWICRGRSDGRGGQRARAKLQSISITGGLLQLQHELPPEISSKSLSTVDPVPSTEWPKCCTRRASFRVRVFSPSASLPWPTTTTASCVWRSIPLWTVVSWTRFPSRCRRRPDSEAGAKGSGQWPVVGVSKPQAYHLLTANRHLSTDRFLLLRYTESPDDDETITHSAEETIAYAEAWLPNCLLLSSCCCAGPWGGKTTLVKGLRKASRPLARDVTSPRLRSSTNIADPNHPVPHRPLPHRYRARTGNASLDDLLAPNCILLIEWGEKFPRFERDQNVEITLERVGTLSAEFNGPRVESAD